MNFISQMPPPRLLSNSFHLWFNPSSFSFCRSISVRLVVFLVVIWIPKKSFSSKSYSFSRIFVILASCHPLELFQSSDILFLPIRSMSEVVFSRFFSPEAIVPEEFFVLTFQLPLSNYPGASFKCSLISSWSLCSFASKSLLAYWFF